MDAINAFKVFDWPWTSGRLSERGVGGLPAPGIGAAVNLAPPARPGGRP